MYAQLYSQPKAPLQLPSQCEHTPVAFQSSYYRCNANLLNPSAEDQSGYKSFSFADSQANQVRQNCSEKAQVQLPVRQLEQQEQVSFNIEDMKTFVSFLHPIAVLEKKSDSLMATDGLDESLTDEKEDMFQRSHNHTFNNNNNCQGGGYASFVHQQSSLDDSFDIDMNLLDESFEHEDTAQMSSEIKPSIEQMQRIGQEVEHSGNYFTDSNMYLTDAYESKRHDMRDYSNSRCVKQSTDTNTPTKQLHLHKLKSNNMDPLNEVQNKRLIDFVAKLYLHNKRHCKDHQEFQSRRNPSSSMCQLNQNTNDSKMQHRLNNNEVPKLQQLNAEQVQQKNIIIKSDDLIQSARDVETAQVTQMDKQYQNLTKSDNPFRQQPPLDYESCLVQTSTATMSSNDLTQEECTNDNWMSSPQKKGPSQSESKEVTDFQEYLRYYLPKDSKELCDLLEQYTRHSSNLKTQALFDIAKKSQDRRQKCINFTTKRREQKQIRIAKLRQDHYELMQSLDESNPEACDPLQACRKTKLGLQVKNKKRQEAARKRQRGQNGQFAEGVVASKRLQRRKVNNSVQGCHELQQQIDFPGDCSSTYQDGALRPIFMVLRNVRQTSLTTQLELEPQLQSDCEAKKQSVKDQVREQEVSHAELKHATCLEPTLNSNDSFRRGIGIYLNQIHKPTSQQETNLLDQAECSEQHSKQKESDQNLTKLVQMVQNQVVKAQNQNNSVSDQQQSIVKILSDPCLRADNQGLQAGTPENLTNSLPSVTDTHKTQTNPDQQASDLSTCTDSQITEHDANTSYRSLHHSPCNPTTTSAPVRSELHEVSNRRQTLTNTQGLTQDRQVPALEESSCVTQKAVSDLEDKLDSDLVATYIDENGDYVMTCQPED